MTLAIYCGSSFGEDPIFEKKSIEFVEELAKNDFKIVYGGSQSGLMGVISNKGLELGMDVTGVITKDLAIKEIENENLTKIHKVDDLKERKVIMEDLSDAFIALPGGYGTLDEIFEVITLTQIGLHNKPCAFYNVDGFYDKLLEFIEHGTKMGFIQKRFMDMLIVSDDKKEIVKKLKNYQAPKSKWSN